MWVDRSIHDKQFKAPSMFARRWAAKKSKHDLLLLLAASGKERRAGNKARFKAGSPTVAKHVLGFTKNFNTHNIFPDATSSLPQTTSEALKVLYENDFIRTELQRGRGSNVTDRRYTVELFTQNRTIRVPILKDWAGGATEWWNPKSFGDLKPDPSEGTLGDRLIDGISSFFFE